MPDLLVLGRSKADARTRLTRLLEQPLLHCFLSAGVLSLKIERSKDED